MNIRYANRKDILKILGFIHQLAIYEHLENEIYTSQELLEEWLFDKKIAEVIFCEEEGKEVGFALFFHNFSTFLSRGGIYLEDLFVLEEYRGKGYGKALIKELARIAVERQCGRLEWCCLKWNQPSIDFYLSLNAKPLDEWTTYRLTGDALIDLAAK